MADDMTAPAPAPAAVAPMKRSTRWILIASLTVNFLVAGVIAGALLFGPPGGGPRSMELALGPFVRALDPADRRAIGRDLMMGRDQRPPSRQSRQEEMAALVAALQAAPYAPEAVRVIVERQDDWLRDVQERAQQAVLDRIGAMSDAERLALADRLQREIAAGRTGGPPTGD
jgi:uncharacterized membrane protein